MTKTKNKLNKATVKSSPGKSIPPVIPGLPPFTPRTSPPQLPYTLHQSEGFYDFPYWVSQCLKIGPAQDLFDGEDETIFIPPKKTRVLRPEDRFNPRFTRFSYNRYNWFRYILNAAELAAIQARPYPNTPSLRFAWDRILANAMEQPQVELYDGRRRRHSSAKHYLAFYRFVPPEVQIINMASPAGPDDRIIVVTAAPMKGNPAFELRYSPAAQRHFYLCYAKSLTKLALQQLSQYVLEAP